MEKQIDASDTTRVSSSQYEGGDTSVCAAEKDVTVDAAAAKNSIGGKNQLTNNKPTISIMDHLIENSTIRKSEFIGFVNLSVIASLTYLIWNPLISWYEKREFFDLTLANAMFYDVVRLMVTVFLFFCWSFTAIGLVILYNQRWLSKLSHYILQHLTQALTIAAAVGLCIYNNWPIIPAFFIQFVAVVFFMKMHSFSETNRSFDDAVGTEDASPDYPHNINVRNYCYFLLCPALVYEPCYPRGSGFRLKYFIMKCGALLVAMSVGYLACTTYIIPTMIQSPRMSLLETGLRLLFPLLMMNILVFYILFECICNLFAEITNFGDREFYQDWWNSTSWDEFSRKWNRPVYAFLQKHVYLVPQQKYAWSQRDATIATFLFSALLHEMIMAVCFRVIRLYMLLLMLLQIPLISLGKMHRGTILGNFMFWAGLMLGVPVLAVAYGREWAAQNFSSDDFQPLRMI